MGEVYACVYVLWLRHVTLGHRCKSVIEFGKWYYLSEQ